jgi:hypothetical protein
MTRLFVIMAATAALVVGLVSFVHLARGHDAHTGWTYDGFCCGSGDCEKISSAATGPDGKTYYTTKLGTKAADKNTYILQSKDQYTHACVFLDRLHCLYVPGGM